MARNPDTTLIESIRGKPLKAPGFSTKADLARWLLDKGYTVSEISNATGMAYSQVHSIYKKGKPEVHFTGDKGPVGHSYQKKAKDPLSTPQKREQVAKRQASGYKHTTEDLETIAKRDIPTARQLAKSAKAKKIGVTALVGKLRTPGHPSDIDVGECANCGFDLVVRKGGPQLMLVHVNVTAEEYLAVTQFCTAVPRALL